MGEAGAICFDKNHGSVREEEEKRRREERNLVRLKSRFLNNKRPALRARAQKLPDFYVNTRKYQSLCTRIKSSTSRLATFIHKAYPKHGVRFFVFSAKWVKKNEGEKPGEKNKENKS